MDRSSALEELEAETVHYLELVDAFLAEWPSARISHNRSYLLDAIRRELGSLWYDEARQERVAVNAADRAARMAPKVKVDPFDVQMATNFRHNAKCAPGQERDCRSESHTGEHAIGMPVEDFLAWRSAQQDRMRNKPSYDEQLQRAPKVG